MTGNEPSMPTGQNQSGTGLTIRQHLAAMAMQGILPQQSHLDRIINENGQLMVKEIAKASVIIADALIAELNK